MTTSPHDVADAILHTPAVRAGLGLAPESQNARLRAALADGQWHRSDELHRKVFCVLHSRVAELRRQGYVIEHKGGGAGADKHYYRLVPQQQVAA